MNTILLNHGAGTTPESLTDPDEGRGGAGPDSRPRAARRLAIHRDWREVINPGELATCSTMF